MSLFDNIGSVNNLLSGGLPPSLTSVSAIASRFGLKVGQLGNVARAAQQVNSMIQGFGGNNQTGANKNVLAGMNQRKDPLLAFCWFATMPSIGSYTLPWNYIEEFSAPVRGFESQTRYQEGIEKKFVSKQVISNLSIKCYDDSSGLTQAYLDAWRTLVVGSGGQYNYSVNYKKDISLFILDVTRTINVYTIVYAGCWPTTADAYNLSSAQTERLIASQEFSVDSVNLTVNTVSPVNFVSALNTAINGNSGSLAQSLISSLTGTPNATGSAINAVYSTGSSALSKYGFF